MVAGGIRKKEKVKARFPRRKEERLAERQKRGNQRDGGDLASRTRHHNPSARPTSPSRAAARHVAGEFTALDNSYRKGAEEIQNIIM